MAVLLIIAAVPRLVLLGDIPPGLHGDEAGFGLEGRRILREGNIGVFTGAATGTPAGTFYWIAAVFWVFGDSVYTLRLAYALLGIVSIPLAYFAFKVMFDRATASIAATLMGVTAWHLHFSRIAHVAISWPLVEVAFLLTFFLALKHKSRLLFAVAGILLGFGIYTYAAYMTFAVVVGLFLVWLGVLHYRDALPAFVAWVGVMGGCALFSGLPMASFYYHDPAKFSSRLHEYSVTRTAEYRAADNYFERARIIVGRERDFVELLIAHPTPDGVDGAGLFPLINRVMVVLLAMGGAMCLWRWRSPAHAVLLIGIGMIATGPAMEVDFPYRRTIGMVPFLCAVAAMPLALAWNWARSRGWLATAFAGVVVALTVASVGAIDLHRYFTTYDDDPVARKVFAYDMRAASEFIAEQPESTYVYFVFDSAHFNHEIRQFIAPKAQGDTRAAEWIAQPDLRPDRTRDILYVFMGKYLSIAPAIAEQYPGGWEHRGEDDDGNLLFIAYLLPHTETPPP